jgi:hypothetical protein
MSVIPLLSAAEFFSLVKIGAGPLRGTKIPPEHLLKLVGLRYIGLTQGQYEPTVTGLARIASEVL